tara:strand:- start:327 stop:515 length:189 start_codon:yes stop_codon:yes gene_type:complete
MTSPFSKNNCAMNDIDLPSRLAKAIDWGMRPGFDIETVSSKNYMDWFATQSNSLGTCTTVST